MDLLDQIERELVKLTTADLEAGATGSHSVFTPQTPSLSNNVNTVIPAEARMTVFKRLVLRASQ